MQASVEISLYPLTERYGTPILAFIERLQSYPDLEVFPNTMSTQIFGDYDRIMSVLTKEMKAVFAQKKDMVMVFKVVNINLKP
ncbi:MAG: hypothetical protein D6714_08410 [Bacteroidetes bacterium]|nr:MAG: hypothetical protein D6714_08410 [Bacteroidota bacterium]